MRTVYPNDMVAHLWAHQSQSEARSGNGNLYFEGPTIYSYGSHFPIARHITNHRGERAVLFTTQDYSITTSGHKSRAWSACHHMTVFHVRYVDGGIPPDNLDDYRQRHDECLEKAERARVNRELHERDALRLRAEAEQYAAFFDIEIPDWPSDAEGVAADRLAALWELWADGRKYSRPSEGQATPDQERRRKSWYRKGRKAEWDRWASGHQDAVDRFWGRPTPRQKGERQAWEARRAAAIADEIAAWRSGTQHWPRRHGNYTWPDTIMRLTEDRATIETSMGATFPAAHGVRAFPLIARCRERGETWRTNGHSIHLGPFAVDEITAEGNVRAGCHFVKWAEVEYIARELGLLDSEAA